MISGILTAILLATFIGLTVWAWSKNRKSDFAEAASLPLEDELKDRGAGQ
jgi:cytochrome c oxidase cbb3-type subunit 4